MKFSYKIPVLMLFSIMEGYVFYQTSIRKAKCQTLLLERIAPIILGAIHGSYFDQ